DLNKNRELIPNHSAETIYTSRGFILCIDLFRIASGFAFAGDSCDISTLLFIGAFGYFGIDADLCRFELRAKRCIFINNSYFCFLPTDGGTCIRFCIECVSSTKCNSNTLKIHPKSPQNND
ncbi:MAG: hypothetical protein LBG45_04755, partial [Dysgonamonadaceae bacterium]|nr:hypothetical protein [Dysgonamonadaceae bacterium]